MHLTYHWLFNILNIEAGLTKIPIYSEWVDVLRLTTRRTITKLYPDWGEKYQICAWGLSLTESSIKVYKTSLFQRPIWKFFQNKHPDGKTFKQTENSYMSWSLILKNKCATASTSAANKTRIFKIFFGCARLQWFFFFIFINIVQLNFL